MMSNQETKGKEEKQHKTVKLPPIMPKRGSFGPIQLPPREALLSMTTKSRRQKDLVRYISAPSSHGRRQTSLTATEHDLLHRLGSDDDASSEREDTESRRSIKRRLTTVISARSDLMTPEERIFLKELARSRDVRTAHLVQAAEVLERDPLFSQETKETKDDEPPPHDAKRRLSQFVSLEDEQLDELASLPQSKVPEVKIQQDASFRRELWTEYSSDRALIFKSEESMQELDDSTEQPTDAPNKKPENENKEKNPFVYFFKKAFHIDSDNEPDEDALDDDTSLNADPTDSMPFYVLATGVDDDLASPHVLNPPLMDSLRLYLPFAIQQDNFWLKYSLIRDGASLHTLLRCVRSSARTVLAIETMEGDVFGSFTSSPWRTNGNKYYGSGEAFLWRLEQSRYSPCKTVEEQIQLECNVQVFGWTGKNRNIQFLANAESEIVLGGGPPDDDADGAAPVTDMDGKTHQKEDWGFALALSNDLCQGTSGFSVTFDNPSLPTNGKDVFEVANLEVWTLSPVETVEMAERLELGRQFIFDHGNFCEQ